MLRSSLLSRRSIRRSSAFLPAAAITLGVMLMAACEDEKPPPRADVCEDCNPTPGGGARPPGSAGSGNTGGTGGSGGAGGEQGGELLVQITQFQTSDFTSSTVYRGAASISADGPSNTTITATTDDGAALLSGVLTPATWVRVDPENQPGLLPTVQPVRVTDAITDIYVIPAEIVDTALTGLTIPAVRETGTAQIFIELQTPQGQPQSSISVSADQAGGVAYFDGGFWSDVVTTTGITGLALLYNVPASGPPGDDIILTANDNDDGTPPWTGRIRAVAGAVTFATFVLE